MSKETSSARDKISENRKELVNQIVAIMDKGELPWRKGWSTASVMPHNPVSGVKYKAGNVVRLLVEQMFSGYSDPRWMTFKQAKDAGYSVKAGSKGTLLEHYNPPKYKTVKEFDPLTNEEVEKQVFYKKASISYFIVFNAEQIEGIPPLEVSVEAQLNEGNKDMDKMIEFLKESSECPINEVTQGRAFYSLTIDEITLPKIEQFFDKEEFVSTMLHEMGHSTGHPERLNRNMRNTFGSDDYAFEELIAELSSVFSQAELGLPISPTVMDNHAAYVQSWKEHLQDDPNILFKAAALAEQATDYLVKNYNIIKERYHDYLIDIPLVERVPVSKYDENGAFNIPNVAGSIAIDYLSGKETLKTTMSDLRKYHIVQPNTDLTEESVKEICLNILKDPVHQEYFRYLNQEEHDNKIDISKILKSDSKSKNQNTKEKEKKKKENER